MRREIWKRTTQPTMEVNKMSLETVLIVLIIVVIVVILLGAVRGRS